MKLEFVELDLPLLVGTFGRRLRDAGLPVTPEHSARFAAALNLTKPVARTRLYWTARAVFVSDQAQVKAFDREFFGVFGHRLDEPEEAPAGDTRPAPADERRATARSEG